MKERKGKLRWLTSREEQLLLVSLGSEAMRRANDRSAESMLRLPQRTLAMLRRRKAAMGPGYSYVFPTLKGRTWTGKDEPRGHATDAIQNHIEKCGLNSDPQADKVPPIPYATPLRLGSSRLGFHC